MLPEHPRIIVVGGGVMGLSCAWRLAGAGAQVDLFESRNPGEGATRAALGALWPASPLATGPLQELHRAGLWQFEDFVAELARGTGLPVTFRRLGRVELLNSEKAALRAAAEAEAACANWPAFGGAQPVMEVLEPAALGWRWPQIAKAAHPALLCRATAQVDVPQLLTALAAACVAAGVKLHERTPVTGLQIAGERVFGVRAAEAVFEADAVVVATGAWTANLSPAVAAVAPIRPAKGQGLALQMPHGLLLETIIKADSIYLIPWEESGEVLVGSTTEPEAGFDETPTLAARETLLAGAAGIIPGLKGAVVLRHWSGLRPQNPAKRHPPIMGPHPMIPNLFLCAGHFKTGIGMSPLVSRLMCETILSGTVAAALMPFAPRA
jgi:glycine oxidase